VAGLIDEKALEGAAKALGFGKRVSTTDCVNGGEPKDVGVV
jgi:hypothetical protein